jgi:hypothetical protein
MDKATIRAVLSKHIPPLTTQQVSALAEDLAAKTNAIEAALKAQIPAPVKPKGR